MKAPAEFLFADVLMLRPICFSFSCFYASSNSFLWICPYYSSNKSIILYLLNLPADEKEPAVFKEPPPPKPLLPSMAPDMPPPPI